MNCYPHAPSQQRPVEPQLIRIGEHVDGEKGQVDDQEQSQMDVEALDVFDPLLRRLVALLLLHGDLLRLNRSRSQAPRASCNSRASTTSLSRGGSVGSSN